VCGTQRNILNFLLGYLVSISLAQLVIKSYKSRYKPSKSWPRVKNGKELPFSPVRKKVTLSVINSFSLLGIEMVKYKISALSEE
jgi:hypothetical protein